MDLSEIPGPASGVLQNGSGALKKPKILLEIKIFVASKAWNECYYVEKKYYNGGDGT